MSSPAHQPGGHQHGQHHQGQHHQGQHHQGQHHQGQHHQGQHHQGQHGAHSPQDVSLDPHGEHGGHHHGHVIVSPFVLMAVLLVLLFFTIATVGASRAEIWAAETFRVEIPQWVNVAVAMSIAVVKAVLVAMFFMQLKYDKKINAVIFGFCLFALGLFLGITMLDLGERGSIYSWKAGQVVDGGTSVKLSRKIDGEMRELPPGPVTAAARERLLARVGPEEFARLEHEAHAAHASHDDHHARAGDLTRPRAGLTPGLFDEHAPAADDHGGDHSGTDGHDAAAPAGH